MSALDWLDETEARCEAATPGPWAGDHVGDCVWPPEGTELAEDHQPVCESIGHRDGAFIVTARTDLPRAIAALRVADKLAEFLEHLDMSCDDSCNGPQSCRCGRAASGAAAEAVVAAYRKARGG